MRNHGKYARKVANEGLARVFGDEWNMLYDSDKSAALLVSQDFQDAMIEDGISGEEYSRRIGKGNLRAYADTMTARYNSGTWE